VILPLLVVLAVVVVVVGAWVVAFRRRLARERAADAFFASLPKRWEGSE
jgi:hypothetical protein